MSRQRKRAGHSILFLLALLLMASGALRIGTNLGQALAAEADTSEAEASGPLNCPAPPAALAEALSQREATILVQEAALGQRLAALALTEQVIAARLAELTQAEEGLKATLALADGAAEEDVSRLTEVYQRMKPKDAALLFDAMDPQFASGFLGRMQPDAAAAILSGMRPDAAYALSVLLAGRNASVPKQ
ncbi:hypothetical protein KM031_08980 [Gemmobacter fulvus]|uniref:Magnesium transporter MgtE intracellular domain-containing protein n=1 Tax=Gemmobacter fulvus TaxID=2840474 RepID=A0A975P608_9RHOB|nr:hypothetical protein [Gemmobacter fulvus]MBT9246890.1 hypothetical protein [Gemmobacter fulvus]QWK89021.1 hypothetical protein KM031_08980 [Gemmobacter fulvus]